MLMGKRKKFTERTSGKAFARRKSNLVFFVLGVAATLIFEYIGVAFVFPANSSSLRTRDSSTDIATLPFLVESFDRTDSWIVSLSPAERTPIHEYVNAVRRGIRDGTYIVSPLGLAECWNRRNYQKMGRTSVGATPNAYVVYKSCAERKRPMG